LLFVSSSQLVESWWENTRAAKSND
jgi:hypothetical protein